MVVNGYEMPDDWASEFGFDDSKDEYGPFIKENESRLLMIMRAYVKFDDPAAILKDLKKGLRAIKCLSYSDFAGYVDDMTDEWIKFFSRAFDIDDDCAREYLKHIRTLIRKEEAALYEKNRADDDPSLVYNSPSALQRCDEAEERYYQAKAAHEGAILTKYQLKVLSASV